jgi:hypothetical protein
VLVGDGPCLSGEEGDLNIPTWDEVDERQRPETLRNQDLATRCPTVVDCKGERA